MVEVATAFAVVESKDTDIVTKADRLIPLVMVVNFTVLYEEGGELLRTE